MLVQTRILGTLVALFALAGIGCAGAPDGGAAGASSTLGDTPQAMATRDVWEAAPAGCEGALPASGVTITGAFGEPELRVVFGSSGLALCTDTVAGIGTELQLRGLVVQPVAAGQPLAALPVDLVHRSDSASGDPSPQPSQPRYVSAPSTATVEGPTKGDPSPQPSSRSTMSGTTDGDPSPQPSQPCSPTHG